MMGRSLFYVGSLNLRLPYFPSANGKGITGFWLNDDGTIELASETEGVVNPTYLAINRQGNRLYATSELLGGNEGMISAYAIDPLSGALSHLNEEPTQGDVAAHCDIDGSGRFAAVANYGSDAHGLHPDQSVALFPLAADGSLVPSVSRARHLGKGFHARQQRPHPHCARWSPDNRFMVVCDLGIDKLVVYRFDAARGTIEWHGDVDLPAGSGPRHFLFHPSRPLAYAVCELSSQLFSLAYHSETGTLAVIGSEATTESWAQGDNYCSALKLAPNGRWLYAGNRGHDSIAQFEVQPGGLAELRDIYSSGGSTPRDFAFDPTGRFLLVANQDSDWIASFRWGSDGSLTYAAAGYALGTPMAVAFVPQ
jgi:6-phosphogluconolactonase